MAKYKYLFWDIDGTILDFKAAEKAAIKQLFQKYGFGECTDEMVERYSEINDRYWKALERNEMTKAEILVARFRDFFSLEGIDLSKTEAFNSDYQLALGDTIAFCDDALTILKEEKESYTLVAITNGTEKAQRKKLANSGLDKILDYIFISEVVGFEKPNKKFFEIVLNEVGITDCKEILIIGDSLTSDILGGNNIGIDTCWYNPKGQENNLSINPTYCISDLHDLVEIL